MSERARISSGTLISIKRDTTRGGLEKTNKKSIRVPVAGFAAPLEAVLAACFSLSTTVFQARTISLASSETSFAACERSLPTARPALLSCDDG
jgi:hypothetical protein